VTTTLSPSCVRIEIECDQDKIDGFSNNDPVPATAPTGTTVTIGVEQGRTLAALLAMT